MVILSKPHDDISKYIGINNSKTNTELMKNRFFPLYWDRETMFYKKSEELEEFLRKVGIEIG